MKLCIDYLLLWIDYLTLIFVGGGVGHFVIVGQNVNSFYSSLSAFLSVFYVDCKHCQET